MPAWSPYSSRTTASWPSCRSRVSSGSSRSESGTTIGRVIRCLTRVVCRSAIGSATACLTCTVPTTVSSWSSTGKRECPVSRASSMIDQARSLVSRLIVRTRGVMISPAVRLPNSTERSISSAVSGSSVPSSAEREMREASSVDERAERSSSCGSIPSRRTIALAEPLSSRIGQAHHRGEDALEALGGAGGLHRARDREVLRHQLGEDHRHQRADRQPDGDRDRVGRRPRARPVARSGPSISSAIAGSARKPIARLVIVMPTWAPESWVDSDRRARWTPAADASPARRRPARPCCGRR